MERYRFPPIIDGSRMSLQIVTAASPGDALRALAVRLDGRLHGLRIPQIHAYRETFMDIDFRGATLEDCTFTECDFTSCRFGGVDLARVIFERCSWSNSGDDEQQRILQLPQLVGYSAFAYWLEEPGRTMIRVGCRHFTLAQARRHWARKAKRAEMRAAVEFVAAMARARGWRKAKS